ncbi:mismatch-specific DNA-glycosylase [Streptomyces sp. AK02-01A]|uniref:mismatch-specific DNA-glycosylase n=1 Tax=Streptomyces sp. AK02-01A TaxID=3028648 RepID=UPI0029AAB505|nr:mismatch-specific DNA-glycosylase [Streptomyces sp. AK02-01A]MDX3854899.1 mismatch-specific DNA-glycosylase [Streptomyces sp. AK02-01A]
MRSEGLTDVLAHGLTVVFIGINPAPASAAIGHSFATPGNRFWPALHASGFTPAVMRPEQEQDLLALGLGITSIVRRPTSRADQLTRQELADGARDLTQRLARTRSSWAAFLGVSGYRTAFDAPQARTGLQPGTIGGAQVWILPNPSGRNAHYPPLALAAEFALLRQHAGLPDRSQRG